LAVGAPDLARSRRVYAPDLLGLVGSANKTADYSPAFFARFVAAYFDALEIECAAVVGNSLGGLVALRLALSKPGRVSALSLIGSAGLRGQLAKPCGRRLSPGTESWR
jgi:pimeloyl-ACP methyl ester carboxylesterase